MRWQLGRRSTNVEDRRGMPGGLMIGGGGSILVLLIALLLGVDPRALLQQTQMQTPQTQAPTGTPSDQTGEFVAVVLGETEAVWQQEFQKRGQTYTPPHLVLFDGQVQSACGIGLLGGGALLLSRGPARVPRHLVLPSSWTGASSAGRLRPGVRHRPRGRPPRPEPHGHHRQGAACAGGSARPSTTACRSGLELQADFLAGVWAHHTARMKHLLEEGDIEEALAAASAIGDDKLQQESQGRVVPDSFTHGTSEQRVRWFRLGYETGELERGDTFGNAAP